MRIRSTIAAIVAGAGIVAASASPAFAATNYTVTAGSAAYAAGTARVTPNYTFVDDDVYRLSTGLSGAQHLPFALKVYGVSYSSVWVSSNGNVQFGGTGNVAFSNGCFPTNLGATAVVAPYWDDLKYTNQTEGIFTRLISNGNQFVISWRGEAYSDGTPVRAEVIFNRGSSNFQFRYADGNGKSATIGVETGSRATTWSCNPGFVTVDAGRALTFVLH